MSAMSPASNEGIALRQEDRERVVHVVEYSRYPRREVGEGRSVGYTHDRSAGGLGLDLREKVHPGELLRLSVRDIDGAICVDGLARVVWCTPQPDGRARAGLALLRGEGERPMLRVRSRVDEARRPHLSVLGSG